MATSSGVRSHKQMKRLESRKSHSWWWDSHISPKNSKWLAENLEEMDQYVKRMLKLIEQDADSFAKRAEMYYQKRPELVALVEEFYRGYRALAERYDHLTLELRKNIPSDLQSQGSGISDAGSEPSSTLSSPKKGSRRKSTNRAAGFDVFLGSGGNGSDANHKDGDESSTLTDSEDESDDSSVNNYAPFLLNGGDTATDKRILELESELREVKEKLWMLEEGHAEGSARGPRNENTEDVYAKINAYEQELIHVNKKLSLSEVEITKLRIELRKYRPLDSENPEAGEEKYFEIVGEDRELKHVEFQRSVDGADKESIEPHGEIELLEKELRITKEKLEDSEKQITRLNLETSKSSQRIQQLQEQVDSAQKDAAAWKTKFNGEKRETAKLQERLARLKTSLSDRDHEIRDLKTAVSDAEQKIFPEKAELKSEMSKILEESTYIKEQVRELESRGRALEDEIRMIQTEKLEMEQTLKAEIELLKTEIEDRKNSIKYLNVTLGTLKIERDNLNAEIGSLKEEVHTRDGRIEQMESHLNQLHMEHVQLISGMEDAHRQVEELNSKAKQLEEEVERQKTAILEGAEEKREAIRQLCFSLEHYRNGYNTLRQHFTGHKRVPPVLAA